MTQIQRIAVMGALSLVFSGCARSESCERGRMTLDKAWEGVQTEAAELRLSLAEAGGSSASVWSQIESDLSLLQSSFATEQITWESAKKKASQLQQAIAELGTPTTGPLQSLHDSVSRAAALQADLEKSCR